MLTFALQPSSSSADPFAADGFFADEGRRDGLAGVRVAHHAEQPGRDRGQLLAFAPRATRCRPFATRCPSPGGRARAPRAVRSRSISSRVRPSPAPAAVRLEVTATAAAVSMAPADSARALSSPSAAAVSAGESAKRGESSSRVTSAVAAGDARREHAIEIRPPARGPSRRSRTRSAAVPSSAAAKRSAAPARSSR